MTAATSTSSVIYNPHNTRFITDTVIQRYCAGANLAAPLGETVLFGVFTLSNTNTNAFKLRAVAAAPARYISAVVTAAPGADFHFATPDELADSRREVAACIRDQDASIDLDNTELTLTVAVLVTDAELTAADHHHISQQLTEREDESPLPTAVDVIHRVANA